ncbi:hypothetical protein [Pseudoalteromonas sp. Of7M-16]|uniref:hypothetical protein n=1 Tax=Pseudoalteromonas sp. Of7M-16 TaxID=2917756 RepID=UPI001EF452D7|nr:hypothetical protein [Pseudoalteromonas sp. Of7M-16]MCG7549367.1 hypothetical protein [Pseudoalteromonas sp. Of7M-16]
MKSYIKALSVAAVLFATQSQAAVVFNCSGYVKNVFSKGNNTYEVRYSRYSDGGFELEPVIIYPEQTYLLGPVLEAVRQSQENQVKYTLVVENRDSGSRKCYDGESENALLAITKY